jgi:hypothetical protein
MVKIYRKNMTENVHGLVQNVMRTQKYMNTKYMK